MGSVLNGKISSAWNSVWHLEWNLRWIIKWTNEMEERWTKETNIFCIMIWNTNFTIVWELQITGQSGKTQFIIHSDQTEIPAEDRQEIPLNGSILDVSVCVDITEWRRGWQTEEHAPSQGGELTQLKPIINLWECSPNFASFSSFLREAWSLDFYVKTLIF